MIVAADLKDREAFYEETAKTLGDEILEFNLWANAYTDGFMKGMSTPVLLSDILIFPEQALPNLTPTGYVSFKEGDEFYDDSNWIADGNHYGIRIYDGQDGLLRDKIAYQEEPYYVLIRKESVHLQHWGSGETDFVYKVLESWFA